MIERETLEGYEVQQLMENGKILPKQEKPEEPPKEEPVPVEPMAEDEKTEEIKTAKDVLQPATDKSGTDLAHSANTKE